MNLRVVALASNYTAAIRVLHGAKYFSRINRGCLHCSVIIIRAPFRHGWILFLHIKARGCDLMERYRVGFSLDIADVCSRSLGLVARAVRRGGKALLVMGVFLVSFYATTFAMCFVYGMDAALLKF